MMTRILLFIFLISATNLVGQGIDFFHGTWDEAMEKAKAEEKLIFVDAFAQWCGPCKRMAKTTFKEDKVGDFFNKNFINLKMDMEANENVKFRQQYPVSAFPTLFFIDGDGNIVTKNKGAQKADGLIKMGEYALSQFDVSEDYAAEYEKGDRSPDLVYNYVKALNKMNKPSLKIANEYLKEQKDLTTDDNLKFILAATSEADSRIFDLLIKHRSKIEAITSKKEVNEQIEAACARTAAKAIEFQSDELHEEAKSKMKKHFSAKAEQFAYSTDLDYFLSTQNAKQYIRCCNTYVKKEVKNDSKRLHELAKEIEDNFQDDSNAMKFAEKFANKAAEYGGLFEYYYTYASILQKNGKKSKALEMAEKSLELSEGKRGAVSTIEKLIHKIKNS